ncbi:MAG TPA: V-type ATP synthase subunit D [Frankiaceae bacterium]|nr:V-type ATP synthase subunit D [Frankiaceae bacterium]
MSLLRVQPGRAGRLALLTRIDVARKAAGLLDRKLSILRGEQRRLAVLAERTRQEFHRRAGEADLWLLRAGLLGGQRPLLTARAGAVGQARLRVSWRVAMGAGYPDTVELRLPPSERLPAVGSSALPRAALAHQEALAAGVRYAAAATALARVRAEATATRRRLRSIQDRLLPRLEAALHAVELGLDEAEREEGLRLRWSAGPAPGSRVSPRPGTPHKASGSMDHPKADYP